MKLVLHRPAYEELVFRQSLLADEETMAYNHAYGGTIAFPEERWADWYRRWVAEPDKRFYRYLKTEETFTGEAAYRWDAASGEYLCDVVVAARYRGRGYGTQGLELLCGAAKERGIARLCDSIAIDNPSVRLFRKAGFRERSRNGEFILLEKNL